MNVFAHPTKKKGALKIQLPGPNTELAQFSNIYNKAWLNKQFDPFSLSCL